MPNVLGNIDEDNAGEWQPVVCPQPETPTESMEFLARSWSVSAMELFKALGNTDGAAQRAHGPPLTGDEGGKARAQPGGGSFLAQNPLLVSESQSESPSGDDAKELCILHEALNPQFLSNQQLLRNGFRRGGVTKRKTVGRWVKDQRERKKQEIRAHNAHLHAAVSVAGVSAADAALAAASADESTGKLRSPVTPSALASAAALVASHCLEMAEEMGADREHILSAVNSAVNARTNGDVMALTAGAATALRGAATLRARLHNEHGPATITLIDHNIRNSSSSSKEPKVSLSLNFVSKGGDLLKRTRKGDLHWKQVSININSNWQVVAKMKSKHMGGTFTKKKKCIISGIQSDIRAWPGRESEGKEEMSYFAIETEDRWIEFECRNKGEKQMWVEGIQHMLHLHLI